MEAEAGNEALDEFVAEGMIRSVVARLKSGKEATAYVCRGGPRLPARYAVAKVYHERSRRDFANDSAYEVNKRLLDMRGGRVARAVAGRTAAGRAIHGTMWVDHEFDTLSALAYAGVPVPEPYACSERAILMEFVGRYPEPAPQLANCRLSTAEARPLLESLLHSIVTMLRENVIHADLSPFNILVNDGEAVIIDLPQAVDPRFNQSAESFLRRDVANVAAYFTRAGLPFAHEAWVSALWANFVLGRL